MMVKNTKINKMLQSVTRGKCVNNVQKVFLALVNASNDGWVSRTSFRVPSASARLRDLRKAEFGGFKVECRSATELNRRSRSTKTARQTFYRIVPTSVTPTGVTKVLKGVI
jgi:hypothetical protein